MRKVLFVLALIMPMIIVCSCSDDDIDKSAILGTWSVNQEMGNIMSVKIEFDNSSYFKLTYSKYNGKTGDGRPTYIGITERGTYNLEKSKIVLNSSTYSTVYYIKVKSITSTTMDAEIDMGNGKYNITANKQ